MVDIPQGMYFSVVDHCQRSLFFHENAKMLAEKGNWKEYSWCVNAAIYSCRSVYEIILDHTGDPDNPVGGWHTVIDGYEKKVRHHNLIGNYRVQDFHRGAIALLPNFQAIYGPIRLRTSQQKGSSAVLLLQEGVKTSLVKKNASVKYNRPISICNTKIETDGGNMVSALDIIAEYIEDINSILHENNLVNSK